MKELFSTLALTLTTLFDVFKTLLECLGLLASSTKDVTEVVKMNSDAFKKEERLLINDRLTKLEASLKEKEIVL